MKNYRIAALALICVAAIILIIKHAPLHPHHNGVELHTGGAGPVRAKDARVTENVAERELVARVEKKLEHFKGRERRQGELVFAEKPDLSPQDKERLQATLTKYKLTIKETFFDGAVKHACTDDSSRGEEFLCLELMKTGALEYAEPNYLSFPLAVPNDPSYGSQWYHTKMNSAGAWDTTTGSEDIIVAVLDSGVDLDHPDLVANLMLPGYNAVRKDSTNMNDTHGHGTYVAGCVGAVGNNGKGIAGINWKVKILPIRIMDDANQTDTTSFLGGIQYAADHGARCVNISYDAAYLGSIYTGGQYLRDRGGLLFCASGNVNYEYPHASANPKVIIVGATNKSDARANFSTYGSFLDIVAPGVEIITTKAGGGYATKDGTSLATPIASGLAALIFSVDPAFTPDQVESIIFSTCKDLGTAGWDKYTGHGRIQAKAAIDMAKTMARPTVSVRATDAVAAEAGQDTGTYTISRSGDTTDPMTVQFSLGGSATGADYAVDTTSPVTIPSGQSSVVITMTPVDDTEIESAETVTITLAADAAYIIGSATAGISIEDDDNTAPDVTISVAPSTTLTLTAGIVPWTPADITPAAWYDASDASSITAAGGVVSQWADKSGNSNILSGSGNPMTGTRTINGLNVIDFDGNGDELVTTSQSPISSDSISIFAVQKHDVLNVQSMTAWTLERLTDTAGMLFHSSYNSYFSLGQRYPENTQVKYTENTNIELISFVKSGTASQAGWIGGTSIGVQTGAVTSFVPQKLALGSRSGANYLDGAIGEYIIVSGALSTDDRQNMEGYLAHKWGLAGNLPSEPPHPHKAAPPTKSGIFAVASLSGSAIDPEGHAITSAAWTVVQPAPGPVTFGDAMAEDTTATFTVAGTYILRLTATDELGMSGSRDVTIIVNPPGGSPIADVNLPAGISLYGYTGQNPIDAKAAFQALIDNNLLSLVRWVDSSAGGIKELYFTTFPSSGWVNEIGDLTLGQGYVVKTTAACTLSITGDKDTGDVTHNLPAGYSIIGFNKETPMDAQTAFQELITAGKLELVRWVDPASGQIKELYYTTFPSAGWVNEIGNMREGQGYIIKLNAPHTGFTLP